jgi:hypothetical protein
VHDLWGIAAESEEIDSQNAFASGSSAGLYSQLSEIQLDDQINVHDL